ncbi:MAG: N-acetylmuramoyl-L-alanine amidase [Bacteroidota bacterium]
MIKSRLGIVIFSGVVLLFTSFTKNNTELLPKDEFVVVLDAGHGGHDPGNLGNGYLEKNIALRIVLKVGAILEAKPGVKVVYTRKDDTFVNLYERGEIANKANADLFISVHCDSHNSDAHGAGTFVMGLHANKQNFEVAKKENSVIYLEDNYEEKYAKYDINSAESVIGLTIMQEEFLDQSIQFAKMLQDNFTIKLNRKDRKVKQAGFIVLHQTFMPSVLIETGFLTNKNEGSYLNSKRGQEEMGVAIANAVLSYKNSIDSNTVVTEVQDIGQLPPDESEEQISGSDQPIDPSIAENDQITQQSDDIMVEEQQQQVKEAIIKEPEPNGANNIFFKVQLMASSKTIPLDGNYFNGLNTLSKEPYNNLYRYMYGNTNSYFKAKLLKSNADAKGYTTSYIVAYKDGVRIPLDVALKYASQQ